MQLTYKALLEAFADCKDAERAAWALDEMREMQVQEHVLDRLFVLALGLYAQQLYSMVKSVTRAAAEGGQSVQTRRR